jgi:hypothetical protein
MTYAKPIPKSKPSGKGKSNVRQIPTATRDAGLGYATGFRTDAPGLQPSYVAVDLNPSRIQSKLKVGSTNDPLERNADKIADRAMRKPTEDPGSDSLMLGSSLHSSSTLESSVWSATAASALNVPLGAGMSNRMSTLQSQGGSELDPSVRANMERRLGADLSHVRIHAGGLADELSRSLGASAFSVGRHIAFAQGKFRPNDERGQRLLAHEIVHTLQPSGGQVVRRSPPQDGEPRYGVELMQELLLRIHLGRPDEVTTEELSRLSEELLEYVLDVVITKVRETRNAVLSAEIERVQITYNSDLAKLTALGNRILTLMQLQTAVSESVNFKTHATKVRESGLTDDTKCFYDIVMPRIPKYLKVLQNGGDPVATYEDRVYSGYLDETAVVALVSGAGKLMASDDMDTKTAKFVRSLTVAPTQLAQTFFTAGSDTDKIAKVVKREYNSLNKGLAKLRNVSNEGGVGIGSSPVEILMSGLANLADKPGSLYSCAPGGGGLFPGMSPSQKKDLAALKQVLAERAEHVLESMPDKTNPHVVRHEIGPGPNGEGFTRYADAPRVEFAPPRTLLENMMWRFNAINR